MKYKEIKKLEEFRIDENGLRQGNRVEENVGMYTYITPFKNDEIHGVCYTFKNKIIWFAETYVKGERLGRICHYDDYGIKTTDYELERGVLVGLSRVYTNGLIEVRCFSI